MEGISEIQVKRNLLKAITLGLTIFVLSLMTYSTISTSIINFVLIFIFACISNFLVDIIFYYHKVKKEGKTW